MTALEVSDIKTSELRYSRNSLLS